MKIGSFEIADPTGHPLVIAEAGVNHNGRLDEAIRLVDVAVSAGADAVKFQLFRASELTVRCAPAAAYQIAHANATSQYAMLESLELSLSAFGRIKRHCDQSGILFLATPFSPADVDRLIDLGVPAIKIASTDLANWPLLEKALTAARPLIISTGASTKEEIDQLITKLRPEIQRARIAFLHCVSAYPAGVESLNLRAIGQLARLSGAPVGFSDHSTSVETGAWAVACGACILEKHFTLSRFAAGPDHFFSLEPSQLARYIKNVRAVTGALGTGALGYNQSESEVRRLSRRSIVCARGIHRGQVITPDHLALKRPGDGLPPRDLPRIFGKRARCDIPADAILSWDMLE